MAASLDYLWSAWPRPIRKARRSGALRISYQVVSQRTRKAQPITRPPAISHISGRIVGCLSAMSITPISWRHSSLAKNAPQPLAIADDGFNGLLNVGI